MDEEKMILDKFGVSDFRHITKNNIMALASELHNVSPEVTKKIIDQFPELANLLNAVLSDCKLELDAVLESENKSEADFVEMSNKEIATLESLLSEDLSFEQKMEIMDRIDKIRVDIKEHHSEKRQFLMGFVKAGAAVVMSAIIGAFGFFGIKWYKQPPDNCNNYNK